MPRLILLLPFVIGGIILLKSPITSSLWLDETITYWIISDDLSKLIGRTIQFQGQSPLYYLLMYFTGGVLGHSEIALRIISFILVGISALVVYKLSRRFMEIEGAIISTLAFISHDGVVRAAFSARPYSLALLFSTLSFLLLIRWIESNNLRYGAIYLLTLVGLYYSHYLFVLILASHLTLVLLTSNRDKGFIKNYLFLIIISLITLVPCRYQLLLLYSKRSILHFAPNPHFGDLLKTILPISIFVYVFCGLTVGALMYGMLLQIKDNKLGKLWISSFLFGPILFYLSSHLSGQSLFIDRYFLWYVVPLSIGVGVLFDQLLEGKGRLIGLSVFVFMLFVREADRRWQIEDWRGAVQIAQENRTPILLYSGLIESEDLSWLSKEEFLPYLSAPFLYYGEDKSKIIPISSDVDEVSIRNWLSQKLSGESDLVTISLLKLLKSGKSPYENIQSMLTRMGYTLGQSWELQGIRVARFQRGN